MSASEGENKRREICHMIKRKTNKMWTIGLHLVSVWRTMVIMSWRYSTANTTTSSLPDRTGLTAPRRYTNQSICQSEYRRWRLDRGALHNEHPATHQGRGWAEGLGRKTKEKEKRKERRNKIVFDFNTLFKFAKQTTNEIKKKNSIGEELHPGFGRIKTWDMKRNARVKTVQTRQIRQTSRRAGKEYINILSSPRRPWLCKILPRHAAFNLSPHPPGV